MSKLLIFRHNFRNKLKSFSINQKIKNWYDFYEDFIGVKEVRKTQEAVLKSEHEFVESTKARRILQDQLIGLQQQIQQIRHKLDSMHRSHESYLDLITSEHQLIKNEIKIMESFRSSEDNERNLFEKFSQKLRDAHEVERLRQEKTKYLSLIGSLIGAALGIIGTSINYGLKKRDIQKLVHMIEVQKSQNQSLAMNVSAPETQTIVKEIPVPTETQCENQNKVRDNKIVELISSTESNLEYRMKVNSLMTVVTTYGLIAITLPIILRVFSD